LFHRLIQASAQTENVDDPDESDSSSDSISPDKRSHEELLQELNGLKGLLEQKYGDFIIRGVMILF